jgi:hypothetical protein
MTIEGIAGWFGLSRSNFILDPQADADFYAKRTRVDIQSIVESLRIDLVTELPPKRLFWGLYGGGKTHTLFKVTKELEKLIKIFSVYVECPNLAKKSTFVHLYHDGIMASMGQDLICKLFEDLIEDIGLVRREELLKKLKEVIGDEELSRAVASLLGADPNKKLAFWRYISGVSVPQRDIADLGQTQDLTEAEPAKLAEIIVIIGKVLKRIKKQILVLILDELDRLEYVGDETGTTFQNAFRKLMDPNQRDVAVLMGCSAGNLKELPDVFGVRTVEDLGPVISRLGQTGLVEISQINPEDADVFIQAIIQHLRKQNLNINEKIAELKQKTSDTLEPDFFPFTKESIEALKGTLRGIMTPREITQRMTQAAGKAYLMQKPIITKDVIG